MDPHLHICTNIHYIAGAGYIVFVIQDTAKLCFWQNLWYDGYVSIQLGQGMTNLFWPEAALRPLRPGQPSGACMAVVGRAKVANTHLPLMWQMQAASLLYSSVNQQRNRRRVSSMFEDFCRILEPALWVGCACVMDWMHAKKLWEVPVGEPPVLMGRVAVLTRPRLLRWPFLE